LRTRAMMPAGESALHCVECSDEIPDARRANLCSVPGCN
jgi:hypothetical protein